jgi:hypothetical protein
LAKLGASNAAVEICDVPDARGGAWSTNGTIVFAPRQMESGLLRVSQNGGTVEPATLLDVPQGENSHRWPVFLPDGIHFLYYVRAYGEERRGVYVGRIDRPASRLERLSSGRTPRHSTPLSTVKIAVFCSRSRAVESRCVRTTPAGGS